ncbi:hypothetical protein C882_1447 [Caenispirillum salinarum AK4]|uniref:DUF4142 domain-containing protein n=1 Tax=Caenispirillum salinarum AK4 TaxID=1238182 RepID=K9HG60_9PROT|nr:DUF4142 domain-containing protein [Caenispirillum salinarum]EKV27601.1 hypothetical protein C882_1447 [Caenispirillum salinarum AK4]
MKKTILTAALGLLVIGQPAWGQANIKPDTDPRIPQESTETLPSEDREFLRTAVALNKVEDRLGDLAVERAGNADLQELAVDIASEMMRIDSRLHRFAREAGVDVQDPDLTVDDAGGSIGGAAAAVTWPANVGGAQTKAAVEDLSQLEGEAFDARFIEAQLNIHDRLIDLYQTQASNSADREIASFAIKALVTIQRNEAVLKALAPRYGVEFDANGQPPQYGPAD